MSITHIVAANYRRVLERIAAACLRVGRNSAEVTLVAVTKYAKLDWVRALVAQGHTELGENRPQQLFSRALEIGDDRLHWHLIGPLQRNKVRSTLPAAVLIHSIDSMKLLQAIERIAAELELEPRVLLEVNLSGEEAKHGFRPDELVTAWEQVLSLRRVRVEGLMTMAAYSENPEDSRPAFRALRNLRDRLRLQSPGGPSLPHLSMGMSGDFEAAIEEGATLVRIGSALWEGLG
ncbi:MAG: YggS family pyridoxal phosphate-dependent enzyme [Planctomycetaceae bacterium]|nr:YggS family pyridoxal phosphate-dependent enzyme [Planctomycetaceae bacterium]